MTFRASVERYLGSQLSSAHATLTVLPRQTEAGNPDIRVWSGDEDRAFSIIPWARTVTP
jgi:hypothetical protein